jgi:hypothetical protein
MQATIKSGEDKNEDYSEHFLQGYKLFTFSISVNEVVKATERK